MNDQPGRGKWPKLTTVDVRYHGQFAYVVGELADGNACGSRLAPSPSGELNGWAQPGRAIFEAVYGPDHAQVVSTLSNPRSVQQQMETL